MTGIIELAPDAPVGRPASEVIRFEGPVIEVAVTPNRSDCFGVLGIARELAAAGLGTLLSRDFTPGAGRVRRRGCRSASTSREGEEAACPLFVGRVFRGLRNGPSPAWLQERLTAIGLRPISTLVDITNLVTLDLGRPLHVFDAAKLQGDLSLRFARPGERFEALDGRTYELDPDMTVIADALGRDQPRRHHGRREHRLHGGDHRGRARGRAVRSRADRARPAAGSASRAMRARASSAASTRRWCCPAWSTRPG